MNLILFDVDHTILMGALKHLESMNLSVEKVFGVKTDIHKIDYHGHTDRYIIETLLKFEKLDTEKVNDCLEAMREMYSGFIDKEKKMVLLPGVKELLAVLKEEKHMIGLTTGNLSKIAHMKMKKLGIDDYFICGGFGDNITNRADLVREANSQAELQGLEFDNVFVVGDTPLDIKSAKDAGVKSIGVATGSYSEKDLKKHKPDLVLKSLEDKEKFIKFVG